MSGLTWKQNKNKALNIRSWSVSLRSANIWGYYNRNCQKLLPCERMSTAILQCVSSRFTELYVEELENEADLRILVSDYLRGLNLQKNVIAGIIKWDSLPIIFFCLCQPPPPLMFCCWCSGSTWLWGKRPTPTWWTGQATGHTTACAHCAGPSSTQPTTPAGACRGHCTR